MAQTTPNSMLSVLRTESGSELEKTVVDYRARHEADIQTLMEIVTEQKENLSGRLRITPNSREWFAIALLGDLRVVEAAPLLTQLLAVRNSTFSLLSDEDDPHWYAFPAAVALSKIGLPAVNPLLELARVAAPDSTAFQLGAVTLEAILNDEIALAVVAQYARQYPDLAQEDRFKPLTDLIKSGHKRWDAEKAADFSMD
ncbi:MAG: hypothetical protein H6970_10195 [Gammaproteobacteria bacterium]|nr:hypothetical protein [Gammaproteobacteria bacterium]MCP5425420.1 hypothetical protein [Gammaproteobacteria bacterium]MCP5459769.1 hypothetical protein [Gammaproteobacteria bacterium]